MLASEHDDVCFSGHMASVHDQILNIWVWSSTAHRLHPCVTGASVAITAAAHSWAISHTHHSIRLERDYSQHLQGLQPASVTMVQCSYSTGISVSSSSSRILWHAAFLTIGRTCQTTKWTDCIPNSARLQFLWMFRSVSQSARTVFCSSRLNAAGTQALRHPSRLL